VEFLPVKCEECGHENPERAEFCTQCGKSLLLKKRYDRYEKGRADKHEKDEFVLGDLELEEFSGSS
jgi:hypothetical protein